MRNLHLTVSSISQFQFASSQVEIEKKGKKVTDHRRCTKQYMTKKFIKDYVFIFSH